MAKPWHLEEYRPGLEPRFWMGLLVAVTMEAAAIALLCWKLWG